MGRKRKSAEKIWKFIRKMKAPYTVNDVSRITGVPRKVVDYYLYFLTRAGYIRVIYRNRLTNEKTFETVKVTGIKPVTVDQEKRIVFDHNTNEHFYIPPLAKESAREKIRKFLNRIPAEKPFTPGEVAQQLSINKGTTTAYLNELFRKGILQKLSKRPVTYRRAQ